MIYEKNDENIIYYVIVYNIFIVFSFRVSFIT